MQNTKFEPFEHSVGLFVGQNGIDPVDGPHLYLTIAGYDATLQIASSSSLIGDLYYGQADAQDLRDFHNFIATPEQSAHLN